MKYMKRAGIYKASNVKFDPETCRAYSYDWWRFVDRINGYVVFNNYSYSNSTAKHQSKVRCLLSRLGIAIDLTCEAPDGLQHLGSAIEWHQLQIRSLEDAIAKPRTHKAKNEERRIEIANHETIIRRLKAIQGVSQ